jgi:outer membrane protein assembly factor BamA
MEKAGAAVEFAFEEGPQFSLKGISLAGDLAEPEAQLRKIMRAQVGKPVSRKVLMDDLERLKQRLGNVEIEPEFSLDQSKKTASLTLRIKRK